MITLELVNGNSYLREITPVTCFQKSWALHIRFFGMSSEKVCFYIFGTAKETVYLVPFIFVHEGVL